MAKFDSTLFKDGFAIGSTQYIDHYTPEQQFRIVISATLGDESNIILSFILDTGSPWCIINPELIEENEINPEDPLERLRIRGNLWNGYLIRKNLTIRATTGDDLIVEGTFFVPNLKDGETWNIPNFIGLDGFLNRIRFAIDPDENTFYFGKI